MSDSDVGVLREAIRREDSGDLAGCISLLEAEENPDSRVLGYLGLTYRRVGDLAKAEHALRKAIVLAPSEADLHYNLGLVLEEQGRPEAAIQRYLQALDIRGDYAKVLGALGRLSNDLDEPEAAQRYYERALEAEPIDEEARFGLGVALWNQEKYDQAVTQFQGLVERRFRIPEPLMYLGIYHHNRENYERAVRLYSEYLERGGKDPRVSEWRDRAESSLKSL